MEFDIDKVFELMKNDKYPLFVSKSQMIVSFVLKAKELYKDYIFLPEYSYVDKERHKIDVMIYAEDEYIGVDFAYIYDGGIIPIPGENEYLLKRNTGRNERRYQCVKNIVKFEQCIENKIFNRGYFVLLTNNSFFWEKSTRDFIDKKFEIADGSILKSGYHNMIANTTFLKECKPLHLNNDYPINYKEYATLDCDNGLFKYLVVEIK